MTNCRAPPKKVQAEPLASRGDISSNPRKQYANGEKLAEREEPVLRNRAWVVSFPKGCEERNIDSSTIEASRWYFFVVRISGGKCLYKIVWIK